MLHLHCLSLRFVLIFSSKFSSDFFLWRFKSRRCNLSCLSCVIGHMFQQLYLLWFNHNNIFVPHTCPAFSKVFCVSALHTQPVFKNIASRYGRFVYNNLRQICAQFSRHSILFTWRLKATSLSSNNISKFYLNIRKILTLLFFYGNFLSRETCLISK